MDFITNLPKSRDACFPGAKHIWVITDHLTKEHHFVPCAKMTTSHLVRMFIQFVVHTHGLPRSIISDREGQFVSVAVRTVPSDQVRLIGSMGLDSGLVLVERSVKEWVGVLRDSACGLLGTVLHTRQGLY